MRSSGTTLELSASDLSAFLGCRHRTALDLPVVYGQRQAPFLVDPVLEVLQQRGLDHERAYADKLRAEGVTVVDLSDLKGDIAVSRTLEVIRLGTTVVLQAALRKGRWFGRPDVLRRVEVASGLGAWSYEVFDTKLANTTRGGTVLQLALYSDLLTAVQDVVPQCFHVVTPDPDNPIQSFRVEDFSAYFRFIRTRLEMTVQQKPETIAAANYPEPVDHCDVCRWWSLCNDRRRADDHLSFVAGVSQLQKAELQAGSVTTLEQLGTLALPLSLVPRRGAIATYVRVREQARLQLAGRTHKAPVYELLPIAPGQGLTRLPLPSVGDVFLDLEGDPFARRGGREYLFGLVTTKVDGSHVAHAFWALSDSEERAAFEAVMDMILGLWASNTGMHVYHYAAYEPAAFKRLMGRYATREADVDRMLRAELFVDLYAIVKHSMVASVERYSIKDLEPFYAFRRTVALADARTSLRLVERALELNVTDAITNQVRVVVEGYNRDDCVSALRLRDWLEKLRLSVEDEGAPVPRPAPIVGTAPETLDDRARLVQSLMASLTANVSINRAERDDDQQGRWLLAHLLDWHRREAKAPWWEFFRLRDLTEEELLSETAAIAGLSFVSRVGGTKKSPIDRYNYPQQESDVRVGDSLHLPDGSDFGGVAAIDRVASTFDVKKRGAQAEVHPSAVFAHSIVKTDVLADALVRLADNVIKDGLSGGSRLRVAREILLCRPPRLKAGAFRMGLDERAEQFAIRISTDLADTVLAVQGPPGAGKTFTGAHMICELVRKGARVGVTAGSHKVIRNLLDCVERTAGSLGLQIACVQKVSERSNPQSAIVESTDNADVIARLVDGRANVVGGTQWLWARQASLGAVDVLFVDEAGQMSLANVLAASQAARSVVLLGDPQQLEQPQQGTHPEGADVSALEHILQGSKTIAADRGIFLSETWRLPPSICAFTSEIFYERRLRPRPGLEEQVLLGTEQCDGSGLWVAAITHEGNQSSSREEVDAIERLVSGLLLEDAVWIDSGGAKHPLMSVVTIFDGAKVGDGDGSRTSLS